MTGLGFALVGSAGLWLLYFGAPEPEPPRTSAAAGGHPKAAKNLAALWARMAPRRADQKRSRAQLRRDLPLGAAGALSAWLGAWVLFGGFWAPAAIALVGFVMPLRGVAQRRRQRALEARQAWPRLLAEVRIGVTSRGQAIPTALFAAGAGAPPEMRAGFSEAARTWAISTDFEAALAVLKRSLADATADAVCETLLAAHRIGGVNLDGRLRALSEAAQAEAAALEDAKAKQAGARFARSFVALVPLFMALIGLSIGRGREAYEMASGQLLVALCVGAVAGCWAWAGRIMSVPPRHRVFGS